ncbi:protein RGF1 INDUCIBLE TRANSCRIPTION FACTOR 1-like [Magnolia sinica]|uniref:protein RGF1 INDUCIBLE TRANSCRIPTION FACTOR 1-like n=1 Tax=Magnolia sinica TaxID=86752 RepID=UPI002658048D|nr:protein RGF1 INDUCIBLE TRANSCRIPTION FACTOR 1-like [Magnolia sinica]
MSTSEINGKTKPANENEITTPPNQIKFSLSPSFPPTINKTLSLSLSLSLCVAVMKHHQQQQQNDSWIFSLLSEKFFTPCLLHESSKKSEKNIFCLDCCDTVCPHCVPPHRSHRLLQVRRYVYHDVIRLDDIEGFFDCGFVQSYTTNSAKVVFINQRPQTRPFKGSASICNTCDRSLQHPYQFCSLACKVESLVRYEGSISRYLYDCDYMPLSDFGCTQIEELKELEDGQMTPSSVLDGGMSIRTSSGSSANGDGWCLTVGCTATTETVRRKKRTKKVPMEDGIVSSSVCSTNAPRRRKGFPSRSPLC